MTTTMVSTAAGRPGSLTQWDPEVVKGHVVRVLQSPPFARAAQMQRLLAFLVEETLAGRASQLKEYTIAVSVFRKPVDYEPGTTAAVRVELGRLRKLLMEYRVEHGHADAIVVEVPKGSYVPTFRQVYTDAVPQALEHHSQQAGAAAQPIWSTSEERRLITVVSCEFGDEQGAPPYSSAAEFLTSFDVFHEKCTGIAKRYGGTVDGGASDRLIFYFGWPNALEDTAGRALTAALEMLAAVHDAFATGPLGIRIGIATSEMITRGAASANALTRPAVIGEAPSLATKILLRVPLNGILVAESTRRLTGALFDFIPAGGLQSQEGEPKLLWRLLGPKATLTRFRAAHTDSQSTIIGRREEAALILSRWQLSLQGEGQGVVIVGEAGIGKSKLAESVLERINKAGAQLRVQCSPHHTNSTLYPFTELIKGRLDPAHDDLANERFLDLLLARFKLQEPLDRALLRALLFSCDEESLSTLSASHRKDLTLKLLARLLSAQVNRRPTVLLVEDIHWADPTTIELLQDILVLATRVPLLVLLTSRQDLAPCCAQQTNVTSIRLVRLPKRDCNELIDRMVSAAPLSASARSLILDKAEGIPLFLEELTKLFLAADERRLREPSIPESLSDLLASQLDRLGSIRSVAQLAAVIGRQFTREMLTLASGHDAVEVDTALDQLLAAGVIVRQGAEAANVFSFRHALLRDAAYGSMLDHSRRELHYRVGSLLVDSFPELAAEHPEIVARHMMDAGRNEEAIAFWLDAGRKAASRYALAEAITDFRLALEAHELLPERESNREHELEVLIQLGLVIRHARGYGDRELASIYERARSLSAELGKQEQLANAVYGLWTHAAGRGEWRTALTLATEFESLSRRMEDDGQLQVEAFRLLGASAAFRGEFSVARCHFERALSSYDMRCHGPRFGFDPGAASAAYLSWTAWHLGHREEAKRYAAQALAIAEAKNHPSTLAMALSWVMFYEVCERNVAAVIDYNDRLQAVCSERDCHYWQPFGSACAEWAAFQSDREARHLERLLEFTRQFREQYLTSCLLLLGAEICSELQRPEQGIELAAAAQQFIEDHDERVWEAECSRRTAELLLQMPKPDIRRARQLLTRAVRTAQRQEARALEQRIAKSLDELESRVGQLTQGVACQGATPDRVH